jgi:hypothetical protein
MQHCDLLVLFVNHLMDADHKRATLSVARILLATKMKTFPDGVEQICWCIPDFILMPSNIVLQMNCKVITFVEVNSADTFVD